jgi:hypothetical protein
MYRAHFSNNSSLQTLPSPTYNFGTGDFTVLAMVESLRGGTVVARKGSAEGAGNGGFLLVVNPDGSVKFATSDGVSTYQVLSGAAPLLDGNCHTVGGIRRGAQLAIVVDGLEVAVTPSGGGTPPLNVNNNLPITIGNTQQTEEPNNQFIGDIMNVSLWSAALSGDALVKAAFARVTGTEPNLQGYWTLNATTNDLSPTDNPASIIGVVTYEFCLHCVWAQSDNQYAFCHIGNDPTGGNPPPGEQATISRAINVLAGAPALFASIMANETTPTFPAGAQMSVTDPAGHVYNQDQNTDTVFAATRGGQLWALVVLNPAPGLWKVTATAPATTGFSLQVQTVPSGAVVSTSESALQPLFAGQAPRSHMLAAASFDGWWDVVKAIAVSAVVGVVVTGVLVFGSVAAVPALIGGVVAFAAATIVQGQMAMSSIDTTSLPVAKRQVGGMAGFLVSPQRFQIIDANVGAFDRATTIIYEQRKALLYPQVVLSPFNKVQASLIGAQDTRANVKAALSGFTSGYVTAGGHGRPFRLTGWYASGTSGPLQDILIDSGPSGFLPVEAQGKIFHFFACNCGYLGTDTPGLGRALVAAGAVAFFGYKEPFILSQIEQALFCEPDIQIDLSMIAGNSCEDAYNDAISKFNDNIAVLRQRGEMNLAATLEQNRDALVSPSTNMTVYGNKTARLNTGS